MKTICCTIILCLSLNICNAQFLDTIGSTYVNTNIVVDSVNCYNPWDLFWGPDTTLWFTDGKSLKRYNPVAQNLDTLLTIPQGYMLSVSVHPDFKDTPEVFMLIDTATHYAGGHLVNLFRYAYSFQTRTLSQPLKIFDYVHDRGPGEHVGGRIITGQDRKLYVSTAEFRLETDTVGEKRGKILRINLDGSTPSDNYNNDYTYSYGHRNPQGLLQLPNGLIYSSEHGQLKHDELNLIKKGKYYGWPCFDGNDPIGSNTLCALSQYQTYEQAKNISYNPPAGIDYYNFNYIPEFTNTILEACLSRGGLKAYKLNAAGDSIISVKNYLIYNNDSSQLKYGRLRDVCVAPNGDVYFIAFDRKTNWGGNSDADIRVMYNSLSGVAEKENKSKEIKIFPNPASNIINIEVDGIGGKIVLHNIYGEKIIQKKAESTLLTIDVSNLSKGFYFVTLLNDLGRVIASQKIVVSN